MRTSTFLKPLSIILMSLCFVILPGCWESDAENAAEDVIEKTKEMGEDAKDSLDDAAHKVGDKIREAGEKLK